MSQAVNHRRPEFYAYIRDRQQRRQHHVEAADRAATEAAPNPVERVKRGYAASRAAVAEFDAAEPELGYDEWKAAA